MDDKEVVAWLEKHSDDTHFCDECFSIKFEVHACIAFMKQVMKLK